MSTPFPVAGPFAWFPELIVELANFSFQLVDAFHVDPLSGL
jgi:hypothetical protein